MLLLFREMLLHGLTILSHSFILRGRGSLHSQFYPADVRNRYNCVSLLGIELELQNCNDWPSSIDYHTDIRWVDLVNVPWIQTDCNSKGAAAI